MFKRISNSRLSQTALRLWTRVWVWPQMGIGLKMTLLVIVGLISLIALFDYMGTAALNENIRHSLEERVVVAQTVARHVDYILANIEHALTDAAQRGGLDDLARRDEALRAAYARLSFFGNRVLLVDPSSHVVAAYPPINADISFPDAQPVQLALNGQAFAVSRRAHPVGAEGQSALAAAPVRDAKGEIVGALVVTIDFYNPNVQTFTHPVGLGGSGYLDLVDTDGLILASTHAERVGLPSRQCGTASRDAGVCAGHAGRVGHHGASG
ncbi:MAG: cache domain-containing protein [Chloroflexi bacterium]|nr:cache domain-containing protein [Chloroflexota bacterium]